MNPFQDPELVAVVCPLLLVLYAPAAAWIITELLYVVFGDRIKKTFKLRASIAYGIMIVDSIGLGMFLNFALPG